MDIVHYIFIGLALIMITEGLIYALFPLQIKKMMAMILGMPPEKIRSVGGLTLAIGSLFLWFLLR
ncbi:MAG: DUF2065 domain-containing protein [Alphaproteobacteria bacterium]|nr:DUF2065 domain-containing protein [Alphaproteobacteria bacterium]NCQ89155.1 DUF2065 domain-containing protein [Alphaproteobacteria bacterium]NCT08259.1 DUF2065 domain-containing protein [Alphaproteobacteria bacterium]